LQPSHVAKVEKPILKRVASKAAGRKYTKTKLTDALTSAKSDINQAMKELDATKKLAEDQKYMPWHGRRQPRINVQRRGWHTVMQMHLANKWMHYQILWSWRCHIRKTDYVMFFGNVSLLFN
jgi:hypothetical protein